MASAPARRAPQARAGLSAAIYVARRQIRFSDCDPAGIAYTARLIDMLNGVIEDYFGEALAISYHATIRDQKVGLGYAKVDCDFFRPVQMGEYVDIAVRPPILGGASATFELLAYRGDEPILAATLVMVTTDLTAHKAIPIPPDLRAAFQQYEARCA